MCKENSPGALPEDAYMINVLQPVHCGKHNSYQMLCQNHKNHEMLHEFFSMEILIYIDAERSFIADFQLFIDCYRNRINFFVP